MTRETIQYKDLSVRDPAPYGAAGAAWQANFKELADRIGPCNFTATGSPTANDDTGDGYAVGSLWYDTVAQRLYWCASAATAAAVWIEISSSATAAITGGTITGITDLAVADGGTGASDAATARTNLGLGTIATQAADSVNIDGGAIDGTAIGATTASTGTFSLVAVAATHDIRSVDPMVWVGRAVNDDGSGNAHCFSDSSHITRAGTMAYNSYDARIVFDGTADFDHYAGFQALPYFTTSGTTTYCYGLYSGAGVAAGQVTNLCHVYVADATGDGTVMNQFGVYIADMAKGSNRNYAIYCAGDDISKLGPVGIGTAPLVGWPLLLQPTIAGRGLVIYDLPGTDQMELYVDSQSPTHSTVAGSDRVRINAKSGYVWLDSSADQHMILDAGGSFLFRDVDASSVNRLTIDSATGELAIPSNTVGLKLDANGTTTLVSNGTVATLSKPFKPAGYQSSDGTAGATADVAVAKVGGGTRTLSFKNGLYTGYTDS